MSCSGGRPPHIHCPLARPGLYGKEDGEVRSGGWFWEVESEPEPRTQIQGGDGGGGGIKKRCVCVNGGGEAHRDSRVGLRTRKEGGGRKRGWGAVVGVRAANTAVERS